MASVSSSISSSDAGGTDGREPRDPAGQAAARRYLWALLGISALGVLPLAASWLFLLQAGELREPRAVARWLQRSGGLYGTALHSNARQVALSIYVERRPEVIALTSSRGTEFRQEFFTAPFSCACMMMSDLEEGDQFLDAIESVHVPKLVILGLDYWWFSKTNDYTGTAPLGFGSPVPVSRHDVLAPYQWILEGKLSVSDFLSVLVGRRDRSPLSREPKLGVQAIKKSFGTRPDGSWSDLSVAANVDLHPQYQRWSEMIRRPALILEEKAGRYAPDQELDETRLDELAALVDRFRAHGATVVLLLLPIADPVVAEMERTGRYAFISALRQRLPGYGDEFYDFHDPREFGGDVCEFQDVHHGGNALYARMLKTVLERNPHSALAGVVDHAVVADVAERFAGRVAATFGEERPAFRETDFLALGCAK